MNVTAAVEAVSAAADQALAGAMWSLPDQELLALLEAHERAAAKLAAAGLALVREADGRDLAGRAGATSTAALLRHRLRLRPGEAKARVELAAALDGPLTATGAALAAGRVSAEQARVICRAVRALPADLPPSVARDAEAALVGFAAEFDPGELARLGEHLGHVLNPDGLAEKERRAEEARELSFIDQGDGTHRIRGVLDNEAVATLRAAIDALSAPRPLSEQPTPEPEPTAEPAPESVPERDSRSPARRRADALVGLADLVLGAGWLPATGGVRPHISITATIETLLGPAGAPAADDDHVGPLSAEALRRIGCDSWITRVLLDESGVPLDVGREHRLVTPGLRRAVVARDRCCAFPGCDRPASWCGPTAARPR